jgi:Holliday junction DNA helicase RuvA
MIASLEGKIIEKYDAQIVLDVHGVGYEIFCSPHVTGLLGDVGAQAKLFIHSQYRNDGVSLFGFSSSQEKTLFLSLIKVDSVGPKSALNILSAAPWNEIVHLVEEGDVQALAKLPKISKKTAEHVVVKLKGKLSDLLFDQPTHAPAVSSPRRMRQEAVTALTHLGYRTQDIERILEDLNEDVWKSDLQIVIRSALSHLSGNN